MRFDINQVAKPDYSLILVCCTARLKHVTSHYVDNFYEIPSH